MSDTPSPNPTFEEDLAELERVVRALEDGQTGLEEALGHYEQGVALLKRCYGQLRAAEQRILLLTGEDGDGQPLTRPFQHVASLEAARPEARRRRLKPDPGE